MRSSKRVACWAPSPARRSLPHCPSPNPPPTTAGSWGLLGLTSRSKSLQLKVLKYRFLYPKSIRKPTIWSKKTILHQFLLKQIQPLLIDALQKQQLPTICCFCLRDGSTTICRRFHQESDVTNGALGRTHPLTPWPRHWHPVDRVFGHFSWGKRLILKIQKVPETTWKKHTYPSKVI